MSAAASEAGLAGMVVAGDGEPIAVAGAEVRGEAAYVHSVAVDPEARGRHIGTLVLAAAVGRARRTGATWCGLLTEEAEGFFGRHGFAPTEREKLPPWMQRLADACAESAVAMKRPLA
ncbi:MAG: GNAT family N-acetyltransferase [Actinomycetota bacterium]